MRLRIEANSKHPEKTRIYDIETGIELTGVAHCEVILEPFDVKAILIMDDFELQVDTDNIIREGSFAGS